MRSDKGDKDSGSVASILKLLKEHHSYLINREIKVWIDLMS